MSVRKRYPDPWIHEFIYGAARAAWVQWWASEQEERGKTKGWAGKNLMDLAPATPEYALVWAGQMLGKIESMNGTNIYTIAVRAYHADHPGVSGVHFPVAEDFGHYLAMQSLGHGVGWFDDHAKFPLKLPHMEFNPG